MNLLLIDAYDSFVYIIYQYLKSLGANVDVIRNDKIKPDDIETKNYDAIVMGPGPGHPSESGYIEVIRHFQDKLPLFGVCLGMQAITMAFGGKIIKAKHLMHGKTSRIEHTNTGCFEGLSANLTVTRYHSLIADEISFPHNELEITAHSIDDGYIMGVKHKTCNIEGVQFHPESICSAQGDLIFQNFIKKLKKSS